LLQQVCECNLPSQHADNGGLSSWLSSTMFLWVHVI